MKVLAISNNTGDPTSHIADEMRRIAELQEAGVIQQLYLKADRSGAVLLLEAGSADEAEQQLATLPLVERGVTSFEVTAAGNCHSVSPAGLAHGIRLPSATGSIPSTISVIGPMNKKRRISPSVTTSTPVPSCSAIT